MQAMTIYSTITSAQQKNAFEETTSKNEDIQNLDASLFSGQSGSTIANQPLGTITAAVEDSLAEYFSDDEERAKYNKIVNEETKSKAEEK